MRYCEYADLTSLMAGKFLIEALDDNQDGQADSEVLAAVLDKAQQDVDARIGQRYSVPLEYPFPPIVAAAARIFAAEALYLRRGLSGDKNPYMKQAEDFRAKLDAIGNGSQPLAPGFERLKPSVTVITEPAKTTSRTNRAAA